MDKKLSLGQGKKARNVEGPMGADQTEEKPKPVAKVEAPKPVAVAKEPKYPGRKPVSVQVFPLAGVTFSKYPFETLLPEQAVLLVPDPFGKVVKPEEGHPDPTAISVQDEQKRHIGYLKATVAQVVHKALASGRFDYDAKITEVKGGYEGLNWGVDILVRFYEKGVAE